MLSRSQFNPSPEALEKLGILEEVLLDPNPSVLRSFSQSGELGDLIAEWRRLTGPRNVQHITHHFRLDDHTLRVIERIKNSSYYRTLVDYQKFLTTLSGLLHDIDKNTGPVRLRNKISVDKLHPIKSAEMSRDILRRLELPPKTIHRVYTLIHHHQSFGRLFIMYKDKAPRHALRKIAVKIRSITLLECLLALSEGDIRGVQREDAFFTPRVADLLSEYADIVREEIIDFRPGSPLFPQHLTLSAGAGAQWQIDLHRSACFVVQASTWDALLKDLEKIHWGGAAVVQYYRHLSTLENNSMPCAAFIRFLPENIAYWGPEPYEIDYSQLRLSSMDVFYGILLGRPLQPAENLSTEERRLLTECQAQRPELIEMLDTASLRQGYGDWSESSGALEEAWFEPSDLPLPVDPMLQECSHIYQEVYADRPLMGIATRPILMGFYTANQSAPQLPAPWDQVPVFTSLS